MTDTSKAAIEAGVEALERRHFAGDVCDPQAPGACSICYGGGRMSSTEVAETVLAAALPVFAAEQDEVMEQMKRDRLQQIVELQDLLAEAKTDRNRIADAIHEVSTRAWNEDQQRAPRHAERIARNDTQPTCSAITKDGGRFKCDLPKDHSGPHNKIPNTQTAEGDKG